MENTVKNPLKKRRRTIAALTAAGVLCAAFLTVLFTVIIPKNRQNKAMELMDAGEYDAAYEILQKIGKDEIVALSKYDRAAGAIAAGDLKGAAALLEGLDYKGSKALLEKCYVDIYGQEEYEYVRSLEIGSSYVFGTYEQDNDLSNGKEPIEWIVLDKKGGSVLLISKYGLDAQPYNTINLSVTWDTCSLRKWINDTFLNAAFSAAEQAMIPASPVTADKNPSFPGRAGSETTDQVFLLSIPEVQRYMPAMELKKCVPTAYAIAQEVWDRETNEKGKRDTCSWWLRTPGWDLRHTAEVDYGCDVYAFGDLLHLTHVAVRPAMWLTPKP